MKKKFAIMGISMLTVAVLFFTLKQSFFSQPNDMTLDSLIAETESAEISSDGKEVENQKFESLYQSVVLDSLQLPNISPQFLQALTHQLDLLKTRDADKYGNLRIEIEELERVIAVFNQAKSAHDLTQQLEAFQISGEDRRGNVRFTGYYSPVIRAKKHQDAVFKYPVYFSRKNSSTPSVAYVKSRRDVYNMRVEGTSYLEFEDGERQLLSFDGNYHVVESEEEEENEGKTVFAKYTTSGTNSKAKPLGAGKIPLTAKFSIAVDPDYIPLGSVILAEVPVIDAKGKLIGKEWRFVLAQDTGSAIQGPGHIDLYLGEGEKAKIQTRYMNKYGKIIILLPKGKAAAGKLLAQNI